MTRAWLEATVSVGQSSTSALTPWVFGCNRNSKAPMVSASTWSMMEARRLRSSVPFRVAGPLAGHHRLDIAPQTIQLPGGNDLAQDHVSVRQQLCPFWVHAVSSSR